MAGTLTIEEVLAQPQQGRLTIEQVLGLPAGAVNVPRDQADRPGVPLAESTPLPLGEQLKYQAITEAEKSGREMLLQGSLMGMGGMLGGLAAGTRVLPQIAGEMIGTFAGAKAGGMETPEAARASLFAGGAGAIGRGIVYGGTRLAGKMAGIEPETVRAGIRDPRLLQQAAPDAELTLARQLEANTEIQAGKTTPTHQAYQQMLATRAADRIDATPVLDAFTKRISGADHPILRAADRQVQAMGDRFLKRVGPDGKIGIGELDAYIRENFTDPLKGAYARGSEAETVQRLMDIRRDLTGLLYREVGHGAASAQAITQQALTKREAVQNTFSLGTDTKPAGTGAERIRGIRGMTGEAQKNRSILAAYDAEYGTDWLQKAMRLSMQREWAGDSLSEAYAIDSILQPQRPSFVRGLARPIARFGVRATRYAGPVSAGAVSATEGAMSRKKLASESP